MPKVPSRPSFCASHLLYTTVYLRLSMRLIARHHTPSSFSRLLLALAATSAAPPFLFGSPAPPPSTACTTTAPLTAYSTTAFLAYYPAGSRLATLATILCLWFPISLQSYHRHHPYHFQLTLSSPSYRIPSLVRPFFCASHLLYTTVYLRLSMRLIASATTPHRRSRACCLPSPP